jgi:hypothetical protein
LRVHFGVGASTIINRVEVRWPGGGTDLAQNVPVNATVIMVEGEGVVKRGAFAAR